MPSDLQLDPCILSHHRGRHSSLAPSMSPPAQVLPLSRIQCLVHSARDLHVMLVAELHEAAAADPT